MEKHQKISLIIPSLFIAGFGLFACKNDVQESQSQKLTGEDVTTVVGIASVLYQYDIFGELRGLNQINEGDCSGKEEFVNTYNVSTNIDYVLRIEAVLSGGSIPLVFTGDIAKISENDNYKVTYCDKFDRTSYNIRFFNPGNYRINVTVKSFTDKFDMIVESPESITNL